MLGENVWKTLIMRTSSSCEEVSFTLINPLSQWDFMQTILFPKAWFTESCRTTKWQGIQLLSLCLWFFLHDLSYLSDLTSVNHAQLFQFPLTIQRVPATLARLNSWRGLVEDFKSLQDSHTGSYEETLFLQNASKDRFGWGMVYDLS